MREKLSECSNCGKLMLLIGILVAVPLIILPFYPEDILYIPCFVAPALISIFLGMSLCAFGKKDIVENLERHILLENSSLVVLFAWGWGIIIGSLPFILGNKLTLIQALFEAVSGWTTTGLSTMDVSITPKIYLFHRSFMQFCGGLGFIMVMIMFISGKTSMNLFHAEGHPDKLMPNLKKTVQTIFVMYNLYFMLGTIAYKLAGMSFFDSICHTMCALSTGGFSTKLNSIGEYNSLAIEFVSIALMFVGTTNFSVLLLWTKGKWKQVTRISEVRFMFIILGICIPVTAFSLINGMGMGIGEGIRRSTFDIISALSTSGYSTMSYTLWPSFAIGILILMMLVGGGIGSTAGGIKMTRIYLMFRLGVINMKKRIQPAQKVEHNYYMKAQGKEKIDQELVDDTIGFIFCYILIFIIGTLLITLTADCGLIEGMFEFASAFGTVGLSIGVTGPETNSLTLIIEIMGMILGRLEIFIVLIGLYSCTNIIRKKIKKR